MKKISLIIGVVALLVTSTIVLNAQTSGAERAEGIARGALSDCISTSRAGGAEILVTSFPSNGEGNWAVRFCSTRRDIAYPAQKVGYVIIENWEVVETACQIAPTDNPC